MNKAIHIFFFIALNLHAAAIHSSASDYIVELFEEHYREKLIVGTGDMKVNHTMQVKTIFGNKVLILTGRDYNLRKWIRGYIKRHKLWIVKIPDEGDDRFKYDMAVVLDIEQLQPVRTDSWNCIECRDGAPPVKPKPVSEDK